MTSGSSLFQGDLLSFQARIHLSELRFVWLCERDS